MPKGSLPLQSASPWSREIFDALYLFQRRNLIAQGGKKKNTFVSKNDWWRVPPFFSIFLFGKTSILADIVERLIDF